MWCNDSTVTEFTNEPLKLGLRNICLKFKKKKAKKIDTFLNKHFWRAGHLWSSNKALAQPGENITHKSDSTERFKNI